MDKTIAKFRRASAQRLACADFLMDHDFRLEAVYIGGYAVECALKAMILSRTAKSERREALQVICRGAKSHDFEYLKSLLGKLKCSFPLDVLEAFRDIATWTTDLRYEVGSVAIKECQDFLWAARKICAWVERSLG